MQVMTRVASATLPLKTKNCYDTNFETILESWRFAVLVHLNQNALWNTKEMGI